MPTDSDEQEIMRELGDLPVAIGLRQQGHLGTVERMLRNGNTWDEIGAKIGWAPAAARDWWAAEVIGVLRDLRERVEHFKRKAQPRPCVRCKYVEQVVRADEAAPQLDRKS